MPIKSYIAVPLEGKMKELQVSLQQLEGVEISPSENKDVLVLITDTPSEKTDKELFNNINQLEHLQLVTLVSAFAEDNS